MMYGSHFGEGNYVEAEAQWKADIAKAYRIFARYPFPVTMEGAPKHNMPEVLMKLRAAPLKALSAENLGPFAGSAIYTIGEIDDYKHFLPRILELGRGEHPHVGLSPEAIAGKVVYAGWTQWPEVEQAVIRDVLASAWRVLRASDPNFFDASRLLCANAILGVDLDSLLSDWLPLREAHAVVQTAKVVQWIMHEEDGTSRDNISADTVQWLRNWACREAVWQVLNTPVDLPAFGAWEVGEARKTVMRH